MKLKRFCVVILSFLTVSVSSAYSVDTHFYECYAMLRWAGIRHEVALELSLYNQWIDMQLTTSAMFPVIWAGERDRRLFHFPTDAFDLKLEGETDHGARLRIFGMASKNHPMASEMLTEGLRTGNRMMVGAGLHTLFDSYAHSGNPYSLGHVLLGHWPDRPFTYMDKHNEMRETFFKAIVAIRKLMPAEALDATLNMGGGKTQLAMDAKELFLSYSTNDVVKAIVESDPMRDPRYVKAALGDVLKGAQANELITNKVTIEWIETNLPGLFESGMDTRSTCEAILLHLMKLPEAQKKQLINFDHVYAKVLPGLPVGHTFAGLTITREILYQQLGERAENFILNSILEVMLDGFTPEAPFRDSKGNYADDGFTPKAAFEDGKSFQREMQIKLDLWQNGLQSLFGGDKIVFSGSNLKTKIFAFFSRVKAAQVSESFERIDKVSMRFGERMRYFWMTFKYAYLDLVINFLTKPRFGTKSGFIKEHGKTRLVADPANLLYQMPDIFDELLARGFYKNILTEKQMADLKSRHEKKMKKQTEEVRLAAAKAGAPVIMSCAKILQ